MKQETIAPCGVLIYTGSILPSDLYAWDMQAPVISVQKFEDKNYGHFTYANESKMQSACVDRTIAIWRVKAKPINSHD